MEDIFCDRTYFILVVHVLHFNDVHVVIIIIHVIQSRDALRWWFLLQECFDPKGRVFFNKYEDNILLEERKYNVHVVYIYIYVCIYTCKPLWLLVCVCLLIVSTAFASILATWILMYYQYRWLLYMTNGLLIWYKKIVLTKFNRLN